jgi:hypothetical protein
MFRLTPPDGNKLDDSFQGKLFWNQHIF